MSAHFFNGLGLGLGLGDWLQFHCGMLSTPFRPLIGRFNRTIERRGV